VIAEDIKKDRFLAPHARFFTREIKVIAYRQFLASYLSVTLENMARNFGVTTDFVDAEVSRFVASGRLYATIDKVNGVIETNRPDTKNGLYQDAIKHGDVLLNRVQKLSRINNL